MSILTKSKTIIFFFVLIMCLMLLQKIAIGNMDQDSFFYVKKSNVKMYQHPSFASQCVWVLRKGMVFCSQDIGKKKSINPATKEIGFFIRETHSGFWVFSEDVGEWPIRENISLLEKVRGTYIEISKSEYDSCKDFSVREKNLFVRHSKKNTILLEPAFFSFYPGGNGQSFFDKILIHKVQCEGSQYLIKGYGEILFPGKKHETYISEGQSVSAKMELLYGKSVVLNSLSLSFNVVNNMLVYRGRKFFRLIK